MKLVHKYSNEIRNKKILIIGPYPPPLGGVAIHVKRVKAKLEDQDNRVYVYDTGKKFASKFLSFKNFCKKIFSVRPDIIFYHEPTESVQKLGLVIFFKFFLRFRLTVIDHDCRILYDFGKIKRFLFRFFIKFVDKLVVIGDTTERCYCENNLGNVKKSIESPFLPPDLSEEEEIFQKSPNSVKNFANSRTPLITATAFAPCLYKNRDLYGFDMCIGLVKRLKSQYPEMGVLFGICKIETPEHKNYFEKIKRDIRILGLENNFYFLVSEQEFWPFIKKSDLFVRPTLSDSFGISIQEAISLGVPAIASNVCKRPDGTILFTTHFWVDVFLKAP
jgi:glycosyltransferase involved in cell wall biosynthesis